MTDDNDNLPVVPEEDSFPTEYWPDNGREHKYTDEVLLSIVSEIAHTNQGIEKIVKAHGMTPQYYYRLRGILSKFHEATEHAKAVRRERLNDEILEIADAEFDPGMENESIKTELAIRKLRIDARKHASKPAAPVKGMEKFTLNIGNKTDEEGKPVTIVQVQYEDEKK